MPSSLGEYIKRIRDRLRDVHDTAETIGDDNSPSSQQQDSVEQDLDAAELDLAQIHDPAVTPSLDPPSAGQVQSPTIPASRQQTAKDAVKMAEEAYDAANPTGSNPDYEYIGDRTRTIAEVYIPEIREDFDLA